MPLPSTFQFSQSSLQDFETCARRFELRYVQQLSWPAIESEPVAEAERLARLGADFHRLVHQHVVGLEPDLLTEYVSQADLDLQAWWQNYLQERPAELAEADLYPELTLSAPLRGYRLLARFDLLARRPNGGWLIIDWKTGQNRPPRAALARRMQTRVYPYVLTAAGAAYNQGQPIDPATVTMLYWYARFPAEPESFQYSTQLFQRDQHLLSETIERIKQAAAHDDFPLVADSQPCRYCVYRSLCDRGVEPGPLAAAPQEPEAELDLEALAWDQIAEIQF